MKFTQYTWTFWIKGYEDVPHGPTPPNLLAENAGVNIRDILRHSLIFWQLIDDIENHNIK